MIYLTAEFSARPGQEHELEAALVKLVEPTRAEDGMIEYRLHRHAEYRSTFCFFEAWRDETALEAHLNTPHMEAVRMTLPDLIGSAPVLRRWEVLA